MQLFFLNLLESSITFFFLFQAIVDELMHLKNYGGLHGSSERSTVYRGTSKKNSLTYLKRDGSSHVITPSSSTDTLSSGV